MLRSPFCVCEKGQRAGVLKSESTSTMKSSSFSSRNFTRLLLRSAPQLFLLLTSFLASTPHSFATTLQNGTAMVRGVPSINGGGTVEGSIWQMTGGAVTLNGGATITSDLLVPGSPTVRVNGNPAFGGTVVGTAATTPNGYQITLNGNARLGKLYTRVNPVTIPAVAAPPQPSAAATRSVTINGPGQSLGSVATLRNVTLNGNCGQYAIASGTYGNFIANGGSGLTLGIAGATQPSAYYFQNLTLNGQSNFVVNGPVIVHLANGLTLNGQAGAVSNPEWLEIKIANGGVTLNGGSRLHGYINAPHNASGIVIINGNSQLVGGLVCHQLIVNGGGLLRLWNQASQANQTPTANPLQITTQEDAAKSFTLTANDPEKATLSYTVLTQPTRGALSGTAPNLTYTPNPNVDGADSFTFQVSDGTLVSQPATVSIVIEPVNHAPTAYDRTHQIEEDTAAVFFLEAMDPDGDEFSYEIIGTPAHGVLERFGPLSIYTPSADFYGVETIRFRAFDGRLWSNVGTATIVVSPVNDAPYVRGAVYFMDEDGELAVRVEAGDVDGDALNLSLVSGPENAILTGTLPDLLFRPNADWNGHAVLDVVASDGQSSSAPERLEVFVRPVNDAPVVRDDTIGCIEDGSTFYVPWAFDADFDGLVFELLQGPQHGILEWHGFYWHYEPFPNYNGPDGWTFRAFDGQDLSHSMF